MQISKTAIFWTYCAAVIMAAVPYGLVHPLPLSILCIVIFALTLLALVVFGRPERGGHVFSTVLLLTAVVSGWVLWQAYGLAPSPLPGSAWYSYNEVFGEQKAGLSLAPADTVYSLLFLLLPALTFLTGMMVADSDARALLLLRVLAIGGGCIAVFGIMQFLLSPNMLLAVEKRAYLGSLTAVYVNRNTAATHFGLVLLILVTFTIQAVRARKRSPGRGKGKSSGVMDAAIYGGFTFAAFVALMLTQSRAGLAATAVAALVLAPALVVRPAGGSGGGWSRLDLKHPLARLAPVVAVVAIVLVLVGLFGGRAMQRAGEKGLEDARFCVWPDIVEMIGDNWLAGTGFGTFRTAFSAYRDPDCGVYGILDRAHNSYLEGFATLGIIFPIALAIFVWVILSSLRQGYRDRQRLRHFPVLGFAGTLLVALHALVDFSLQIPGFAVAYAAFLAATIALSHGREGRKVARAEGSDTPVQADAERP